MNRVFVFFLSTFSFLFAVKTDAFVPQRTLVSLEIEELVYDNPLGVWIYKVAGAGEKYEKGVLFIRKENENYILEVQLSNGTLTGQDVQVEGDSVKFNLNIEGVERVSIVLEVKDNTISGKSYSSHGMYEITGTRKLPKE